MSQIYVDGMENSYYVILRHWLSLFTIGIYLCIFSKILISI